jgi:molecular chaperone DnaK (HSP70)
VPSRYLVGIDLGTTNTVVAFAPRHVASPAAAEVFAIPQLVTPAARESRPLLPSVLYAAAAAEGLENPWSDAPWVTGELARRRGTEAHGRLVASSKSWLSHAAVDRTAPILPWEGGGGSEDATPPGPKLSPCDAAAILLGHVRRAWDAEHPDALLADQEVVLTVPASFDETARELTLEAAATAGLRVRLLEEPVAAFYAYRARHGDTAIGALSDAAGGPALVLVCDVGGGTTDLSLVRVERTSGGEVDVRRVAVGRHLLLGGDNMDLALAHLAESRLSDTPLDPARYGQLVQSARCAKELLLSHDAPEEAPVVVASSGARLVGGVTSARISRDEATVIVVDGFFPRVADEASARAPRAALMGFGLPYERELAITRHIAAFFARHSEGKTRPDALLLNGGVFHAPAVVARTAAAIASWGEAPVPVLPHADPDLAVARGAVAYALARTGTGPTIRSGVSRGYYVAVEGGVDDGRKRVLCVVPRGAEEGRVQVASKPLPLALAVGRVARFELYASDSATGHRPGDVMLRDEIELDALPPVFAAFDRTAKGEESVDVAFQGELTETGTLDLCCVELHARGGLPPRRFKLAFQLRGAPENPSVAPPTLSPRRLDEAREAIDRVFGKNAETSTTRLAKDLVRDLERILGERGQWDTATARALADVVVRGAGGRRRSLDHERVFWLLAGFCLRPGVGHPGDPPRVRALFRLVQDKLAFPDEVRGWQQFWFAWRRIAAGLDEKEQTMLRDMTDPFLAPKEAKRKLPKWKPDAKDALLEMASSLERVDPRRRAELGGWLLERTWTERDPRLWAALGRLGARTPTYASASCAVGAPTVERWLDHLLREKWQDLPTAPEAAMRMARLTGDRARDMPERLRLEVAKRLAAAGVPAERSRVVTEVVATDDREQASFLGDGLPAGLRLLAT